MSDTLEFTVGPADSVNSAPVRRVPARVPGAVQLDWARAENWPPYWQGQECQRYRWMEDRWWHYETRLPARRAPEGFSLWLVVEGVDHAMTVHLDGREVARHAGMNTPFELELGGDFTGARLELVLAPAPKFAPAPDDRAQARATTKAAVGYGWDWHPRLVPLGLSGATRLETRPLTRLGRAGLSYRLAPGLDAVSLRFSGALAGGAASAGLSVRARLEDPEGREVLRIEREGATADFEIEAELARPLLWWCHGQGPQHRYTAEITLLGADERALDRRSWRTGFRRARFVMHPRAWAHPVDFPKGRSHAPAVFELNGRQVFLKGANWVPPEIFPGLVTAETYRPLLRLAREAHLNLLTCWGGGMIGRDSFYEQCDELGLLVATDFPLACNNYDDGGAPYLAELEQEARSILARVVPHPCNVLWKGGVELFNGWSGMTEQSPALRLLAKLCHDLDPETPWMPTTPLEGMGHGDYRFRDHHGRDVFQIFQQAAERRFTAYPEFGCPGASPVEILREIIPEPELWPVRFGGAWETHHALNAWDIDATTWLSLHTLRHYWGEADNLEQLVERSQWLQAEGMRSIYEEARRQHPTVSWAACWCFNEPWPTAANNSLVNWPARPKPVLAHVAMACRPTLASARIPRFDWRADDEFECELWFLHDGPEPAQAGRIEARLRLGEQVLPLLTWSHAAGANRRGPTARVRLPALPGLEELWLDLVCPEAPGHDSCYRLRYHPPQTSESSPETARALNI